MAYYRSVTQCAELKKRFSMMKIRYQEGTVFVFQISKSGLFELFLFQSVEKAFFRDCFLVTHKLLTAREKLVLHPDKSLNVVLRRTRIKTLFLVHSKF